MNAAAAAKMIVLGIFITSNPVLQAQAYFPFAGSPTTTNGAQMRGWASSSDLALLIIVSIDSRKASACESFGLPALVLNMPVISWTVASESTSQCETTSDLAPA